MADVPAALKDWSATTSSNTPTDTTTIGAGLADNLQEIQGAIVRGLSNKGADIASASTTDLGAVEGLAHDITGTTTITSFGTVRAGIWKIIKFEGALTLTHNATSLIIPGGANITTADGDIAIVISEGSGNWRVVSYFKAGSFPATLAGTETLSNKTLVAPALGTPSSGTLTNCTGLPASTGISGLGTGVATALAVNVGSAGAPVVNGGALGTPSSGTVTNLTGTASININGTVGATTPSTGAFTTLSASGMISSTVTGQFFDRQGASTAISYMRLRNTSGDMTFGIEGSAGGALASGTAAYSVVLSDNTGAGLNLVSSTGKAVLTSTGLAVTGVTSSTYSFESTGAVQANAANKATLSLESASTGRLCVFGADTSTFGTTVFSRAKSNGGATESMRIDSSGSLLVGTTSSTAGYALKVGGASANILIAADSPNGATLLCDSSAVGAKGAFFGHITTVSQAQVRCGASGGVYLSDGATSWTAISDERQKTDLVPITDALVKVSSLRAVTGRYVWDEKRRAFLIAQEVQQVLPEAVDVADDADGTLGLAYTDVIPLLVASIKELNAKVAALEAKNAQV